MRKSLIGNAAVRAAVFLAAASFILAAGGRAQEPPASAVPRGPADLQRAVTEAYEKYRNDSGGKNADYIPDLATVPSKLFGVAIVTVKGEVFTAGDADYPFAIESVAKPFTLCLILRESGDQAVLDKIGVEPTGMPFNSVLAIELNPARSVNPLVNAGAMAAVSMVKAADAQERWSKILDNLGRFAGAKLSLNQEVYASEAAANTHNRAIAEMLYSYGRLYCDPLEACEVYTRECSVKVTARQLATMGATLANGGVNPITKERCLDAQYVPKALAVMMMAGFYDESGRWAWSAGVPAKTGVGGGIVAVAPGQMAIVGFAPPLDKSGNSVRGAQAISYIVGRLGLNLFGAGK